MKKNLFIIQNITPHNSRSPERGSAIFYILIAIVLFAALNFAVSNINRGGDSGLSKELQRVYAGEIIDYSKSLRRAVQNMRISGVADTDISFDNQYVSGYQHSPEQPDQNKVFSKTGGAINYVEPNPDWLIANPPNPLNYGNWFFYGEGVILDVGTSAADLTVTLSWIKKDICIAINDLLGIENPDGEPPQEDGNAVIAPFTPFAGTYAANVEVANGTAELETGLMAACFEGDTVPPADTYHYYQVLIAR